MSEVQRQQPWRELQDPVRIQVLFQQLNNLSRKVDQLKDQFKYHGHTSKGDFTVDVWWPEEYNDWHGYTKRTVWPE